MDKEFAALQTVINKVIEFSVNYSFQVIGAIIVLVVGMILGKWVSKVIGKICYRRKLDITLSKFLASIAKILIILFAAIIALGKFGITIAPFIAAIGAVAFGATYAIQGPLSNYGAGFSIILGRPFVVGDTISVAGVDGVVEVVSMANTTLINEDGIRITIPNKHIVGEIMHNSGEYRIIESSIGISYNDDPEKAIKVIQSSLNSLSDITKKPLPQIGIENFGDSSVDIGYRYWVPTQKYFRTLHATNMSVYKALNQANITIPFPQREVLVRKESS
ncbi:MAG: mechanosensitive ion channel family protein [Candidatus Theseobacter exili]|nr:mechanosensitive ion channel family protein [Candidatus Theseobacter exili]